MAVRRGLAGEEEEGGWEETEAMAAGECTCRQGNNTQKARQQTMSCFK